MITLYLAEDQSMLNSALTQLLDLEDDLHVLGSAGDGAKAWQDIQQLKPDVAVLDIEMPKLTGLDVADKIHGSQLATKIIILTTFAQKAYFERAIAAQVNGYLLKDSPSDDLIDVIRKVMTGQTVYAPELVTNMVTAESNLFWQKSPAAYPQNKLLHRCFSRKEPSAIICLLFSVNSVFIIELRQCRWLRRISGWSNRFYQAKQTMPVSQHIEKRALLI